MDVWRKMKIIFLVMAAFVLSACGSGPAAPGTGTPGGTSTVKTGPPAAPDGMRKTYRGIGGGKYEVKLQWNDNSDNETGFNIYYNNNYEIKHALPPNTVAYTVTAGPAGGNWCYRVSASNAAGESAKSNNTCVSVP